MLTDSYFLGEEARRNIHEYYDVTQEELGKGSYGKVVLGTMKQVKLKRAIKIIDKAKVSNVDRFRYEVEIMKKLDHPSILRLYDYFEDKSLVYLVLELCTGGELFDRIVANKFYKENEARIMFKQIIKAIHHCHLNGVCHRDLKPENFIMINKKDPYTLKLIDFGLSRQFEGSVLAERKVDDNAIKPARRQTRATLKTKAGTPFYIAPEVLTGNYTEKCDVWSAGVILYILCCGYPPFYGDNNKEILAEVKKGKLDFSGPEWKDKSAAVVDIIRKMVTNQELRLFPDEVFKHVWMQNNKVDKHQLARLKDLWKCMKEFSKLSIVQKLIIYFIAQSPSEEELSPLHPLFEIFDEKHTGCIDIESFTAVLYTHLNISLNDSSSVFYGLDFFGNNSIGYSQFISAALHYTKYLTDSKLQLFFQMADINRDNTISKKDFEKFLEIQFIHKTNVTQNFRLCVMGKFNQSGLLDLNFKEFSKVVKKL